MARHRSAIALLLLALPAAMPARAVNIVDIHSLARDNDPQYLAARQEYIAVTKQRNQALARMLPEVSATAARVRNDARVEAPGLAFTTQGDGTWYSNEYSVDLTQPVLHFDDLARANGARYAVKRARAVFDAAGQDLIVRSVTTYLGLLAALDNRELARAERDAIAQQLELASARLEVGLGTITDQQEAEARFKLAEANVVESENALDDAREALAEIIGRSPEALAPMHPDLLLLEPDPPSVTQWLERAESQSLDIAAARYAYKAAQQEVRARRSEHLPSLDIVAERTRTDADGSIPGPGSRRDSTDLSLELTVPLLQGGMVLARTGEAKARYRAALQEYERQRRATRRETRAAFQAVTGRISKTNALAQAVTASESALEGKREGFEAGLNTNIEVLNAQGDLFRAKRDYLQERYGYLRDLVRLKRSAGVLGEKDLETMNAWLL